MVKKFKCVKARVSKSQTFRNVIYKNLVFYTRRSVIEETNETAWEY